MGCKCHISPKETKCVTTPDSPTNSAPTIHNIRVSKMKKQSVNKQLSQNL